jgi:hypothetical protein
VGIEPVKKLKQKPFSLPGVASGHTQSKITNKNLHLIAQHKKQKE